MIDLPVYNYCQQLFHSETMPLSHSLYIFYSLISHQGASYPRQSFDIQEDTNRKVRVNLWGDDCEHNIPDPGASVILENVVTTIFQDNGSSLQHQKPPFR